MTDAERRRLLRVGVPAAAGAETLLWIAAFPYIAARANPMGDGMEWLAIVPLTMIFVLLTLPALIFGVLGRALRTGAVLAIFSLGANVLIGGQMIGEFASKASR